MTTEKSVDTSPDDEASEHTPKPASARTARPKKKRTVGRMQRARHAAEHPTTATEAAIEEVGGVVGGLAATAAASGDQVRRVALEELAPHPFNDPARSEIGDSEKWDELVRSISATGVKIPGKAVTRSAFVAARPEWAAELSPEAKYVLVYGHRRRAAAIAAGATLMPIVVDDSALDDDGDIDQMALENLGREDLSPIAEADLYARYAEDLKLTQADIAKRLGKDQTTISRRLGLLLLTAEAREAHEAGRLQSTAAAAIAGALPWGPVRGWQRSRKPEQNTAEREADQNRAVRLVLDEGVTPSRAAERVAAERRSRTEADKLGITVVDDPSTALGGAAVEVDIDEYDGPTVGTIDDVTSALLVWGLPLDDTDDTTSESIADVDETQTEETGHEPTATHQPKTASSSTEHAPEDVDEDDEEENDAEAPSPVEPVSRPAEPPKKKTSTDEVEANAAAEARRAACGRAAQNVPSKTRMAEILAEAVANQIDMSSPEVIAQADIWLSGEGDGTDAYAVHAALAWRRVLAGYESATITAGRSWGPQQTTYLELLVERVKGYRPTAWERAIMHAA